MGLVQLLVVGRSLKTAENRPSPYKLIQQKLLPRFGQAKPAGGKELPLAFLETEVSAKEPSLMSKSSQRMQRTAMPQLTTDSAGDSRLKKTLSGRRKSWWSNRFRRGPILLTDEGAIQGELLLEDVKVLRNDLSDADLELVCSGAKTPQPNRARITPSDQNAAWLSVWLRIRARLWYVGRT